MSEENKIGTYQFVAEPFHVDFNGRLTMGVLGNHLLNCAGFHASDRGFVIYENKLKFADFSEQSISEIL